MPNIKSAIKRVKVSEKKNLRNRMIKSAMRTSIKKFENAIAAGTCDAAILSATQGAVDKAASREAGVSRLFVPHDKGSWIIRDP